MNVAQQGDVLWDDAAASPDDPPEARGQIPFLDSLGIPVGRNQERASVREQRSLWRLPHSVSDRSIKMR